MLCKDVGLVLGPEYLQAASTKGSTSVLLGFGDGPS